MTARIQTAAPSVVRAVGVIAPAVVLVIGMVAAVTWRSRRFKPAG